MTLRFYMDQHVPRPITEGLRRRGIEVLTAHEDGAAEIDDDVLLERATQLGICLIQPGSRFADYYKSVAN